MYDITNDLQRHIFGAKERMKITATVPTLKDAKDGAYFSNSALQLLMASVNVFYFPQYKRKTYYERRNTNLN